MDYKTLRTTAQEKFRGACRVCPACNGLACAGQMPGMGGIGNGASFQANANALGQYRLNLRTVHDVTQPNMACRLLGLDLALPVIGAAIGGVGMNMNEAMTEAEYDEAVVAGCRQAGTICMTGDGPKPVVFETGLEAIKHNGGRGIPIIKPWESVDRVIELAKQAAAVGAPAFGMDIDAAAFFNMTRMGQPMSPKTVAQLRTIKQALPIPFLVKGIMTPDDALRCVEAGVDAIVVSNHGGRAFEQAPGTAEVLPGIADAVKGKLTILADGGVRSGSDVLKMLALGADAVLVGRPLAIGAVGGAAEGVELVLQKMAEELRMAMILTGTANVGQVRDEILW